MNDKQTLCILLTNALLHVIESFCSKIFGFNNLEKLEDMVCFSRNISSFMYNVISGSCGVKCAKLDLRHAVFIPLIRQARQFEFHNNLCYMASILSKLQKEKYFQACKRVGVLNYYLVSLQPSHNFLEIYLVKTPHFHHTIPPSPSLNANMYKSTTKFS